MPRKPSVSGGGSAFYSAKGYESISTHVPKETYKTMMAAYGGSGSISMERIARMLLLYAVEEKPTLEELFKLLEKKCGG